MSDLKLKLHEEDLYDYGPGGYVAERALDVLRRYLRGKLTLDEAAREMIAMLPDWTEPKRRIELTTFASFLYEMGRQIPYHHPAQARLVQLIQHLSRSTKLIHPVEVDGYSFYSSLSDFDMNLREGYMPELECDPEDGDPYENAVNVAAFLARLVQCGYLREPTFGIWSMRQYLEQPNNHPLAQDANTSSAAVWIVFGGQAFYTRVVEAPFPEITAKYRTGELYDGPELGLERWKFWRQALAEKAANKEVRDEARRLASRAVDLMDAIELNMQP